MSEDEAHEYAELFPLMNADDLQSLADDVKEHGLRQPIIRYQGKILDGRNRLKACDMAEVEPTFTDFDGDDVQALELVESLNVQRRNLTDGQRAISAAKRWLMNGDTRNKGGRPSKAKPLQSAMVPVNALARKYRASEHSISQARDLLTGDADLADAVANCRSSLAAAHKALEEKQRIAQERAARAVRISAFAERISDGDLTEPEAHAIVDAQEREQREKEAAEADSRAEWLRGLAGALEWINTYITDHAPEQFAWYFKPGAPGFCPHDITVDSLDIAMERLSRIRALLSIGEANGEQASARPRSRRS